MCKQLGNAQPLLCLLYGNLPKSEREMILEDDRQHSYTDFKNFWKKLGTVGVIFFYI